MDGKQRDRKYYFDMPSHTRIKKAYRLFNGKTVTSAVWIIENDTKAVVDGEFICDCTPAEIELRDCLLFLLNGQV